jgi:hypothetical protein
MSELMMVWYKCPLWLSRVYIRKLVRDAEKDWDIMK